MADAYGKPPEFRRRAQAKDRDIYGRIKNLPTVRENVGVIIQGEVKEWYVYYPDINSYEGPFIFSFAKEKARHFLKSELVKDTGSGYYSVSHVYERGLLVGRLQAVRDLSSATKL